MARRRIRVAEFRGEPQGIEFSKGDSVAPGDALSRTLVGLAIRFQWPLSWWRSCTWPEFKTLMVVVNESDRAEREEEEGTSFPRDPRIGRPPDPRELAVIPPGV